eukprot:231290_1
MSAQLRARGSFFILSVLLFATCVLIGMSLILDSFISFSYTKDLRSSIFQSDELKDFPFALWIGMYHVRAEVGPEVGRWELTCSLDQAHPLPFDSDNCEYYGTNRHWPFVAFVLTAVFAGLALVLAVLHVVTGSISRPTAVLVVLCNIASSTGLILYTLLSKRIQQDWKDRLAMLPNVKNVESGHDISYWLAVAASAVACVAVILIISTNRKLRAR